MVTYNFVKDFGHTDASGNPVKYYEGTCLSSDTKPTDVDNGSKLMESDTSTLYIYDAENSTWRAWE